MTLHSLPLFVRLAGRPVMLIGAGEAAAAKRRLLDRAGALVCGEADMAALAIVALDQPEETVARLRARGILVNAVDRPDLCDFTLPAIVERDPVLVAIGTGGVSAGLAAALRQRLEALLPAGLGDLANALHAARGALRAAYPDGGERRRVLARGLCAGGALDPLAEGGDVGVWLAGVTDGARDDLSGDLSGKLAGGDLAVIWLTSSDPDDLTLRQARWLASADRVYHPADVPQAVLNRARADADHIAGNPPEIPLPGLSVLLARA